MRCLTPMAIRNKGKKFGNNDLLKNQVAITIPCGKCYACLSNKRNMWTLRLTEEARTSDSTAFLTLTYDDEHLIEAQNQLQKRDLQLFIKRVRNNGMKVRYYAIGEYGTTTHRPHYHLLIFNISQVQIPFLQEIWGKGFVYSGRVTPASIHYCTYYHLGLRDSGNGGERTPEFVLMSRKPGIGYGYLEEKAMYNIENNDFSVISEGGIRQSLPRYYKDKIFNKLQKTEHNAKVLAAISQHDIEAELDLLRKGNNLGEREVSQINYLNQKLQTIKKRKL